MDINHVETQWIFVYDPINSFVIRSTNSLSHRLSIAAIAHCYDQIDDEPFEERRGEFRDPFEKLPAQVPVDFIDRSINSLLRSFRSYMLLLYDLNSLGCFIVF